MNWGKIAMWAGIAFGTAKVIKKAKTGSWNAEDDKNLAERQSLIAEYQKMYGAARSAPSVQTQTQGDSDLDFMLSSQKRAVPSVQSQAQGGDELDFGFTTARSAPQAGAQSQEQSDLDVLFSVARTAPQAGAQQQGGNTLGFFGPTLQEFLADPDKYRNK